MKIKQQNINKCLILLLCVSALLRGFLAYFLEFGNDEVYYWTYAKFPDCSHFDHPPMVGWFIQLFSCNLLFDSEFFLRLSSVVSMTLNTYLIYLIGKQVKNEQTGFYAALLYTASVYAFVITGIFILPDTPLGVFTLLAVMQFVKYFQDEKNIMEYAMGETDPDTKKISTQLSLEFMVNLSINASNCPPLQVNP